MALQTFTAGQVLTAAQVTALQANDYNQTVSTKTDSYTLVAADKGTRVVMNKATATTITVNTSLFSAGDSLWIHNIGAGVCTITAGTATVSTSGSLALAQNSGGTLYFTSTGVAIFFPTVAASAQGLTLLNTTSFSAVSSVSLPANTFTSTYTNYKILMKTTNSAAGELYFRYRASGTDNTNATYNHGYFDATGVTASRTNNATYNYIGYQEINGKHFYDLDIYSPQETEYSGHKCAENRNHSGNNPLLFLTYGDFGATTSFDSITIYPQNGNITGTYSVYGWNK
jgi:hypothetical protein